jgi:hypothetical protein
MATKKRASSRSKFLNRAVKAGRSYLRQAEKRLPPDVRKQIDRSIKDGQKAFEGALKQLRSRVDRTASQVDLEKALKRLDAMSKQVQQIARAASSRPAASPKRARRTATRKRATAAAPKAAASTAPGRPAPARRAAPRRRTARSTIATPPTVESPSMAIPDPSPREPAD